MLLLSSITSYHFGIRALALFYSNKKITFPPILTNGTICNHILLFLLEKAKTGLEGIVPIGTEQYRQEMCMIMTGRDYIYSQDRTETIIITENW